MQRMAWTDERLEERFDGVDHRFDEVNRRFDEVDRRFEEAERNTDRRFKEAERNTDLRFEEVNKRIDGVETQLAEIRQSIIGLNTTFNRGCMAIVATLLGVIVAILIKGA